MAGSKFLVVNHRRLSESRLTFYCYILHKMTNHGSDPVSGNMQLVGTATGLTDDKLRLENHFSVRP